MLASVLRRHWRQHGVGWTQRGIDGWTQQHEQSDKLQEAAVDAERLSDTGVVSAQESHLIRLAGVTQLARRSDWTHNGHSCKFRCLFLNQFKDTQVISALLPMLIKKRQKNEMCFFSQLSSISSNLDDLSFFCCFYEVFSHTKGHCTFVSKCFAYGNIFN